MRVFVTGASGFIGQAVTAELVGHGHTVLGLARSESAADAVKKAGGEAHRGELTDTKGLADAAKSCDGVIHLAFIHDFSKFKENTEIDQAAIKAMTAVLEGSNKPFVGTTGTLLIGPGRVINENDARSQTGHGALRGAGEDLVLDAAKKGVRSSFIRLSPTVHGKGDHGFVPALVNFARRNGYSAYVGEGANRWSAVHRLDAARLYRLALEKGKAGSRFHGVAEEGVSFKRIAEAIGEGLKLPVKSISQDDAGKALDFLGVFASYDGPASSALTREALGWTPKEMDLLTDVRENYFG